MQSYMTFERISDLSDLFFPVHDHNQHLYIPVSLGLLNPETSGGKYWALDWSCPFQSDGDFGGKEQSPWFAGRQHGATIHCQLTGMYYKEVLQWLSSFFLLRLALSSVGLLLHAATFLPCSAWWFCWNLLYFYTCDLWGLSNQVFKKLKWAFWIERVKNFIKVRGNNLR